MKIKPVGGLGPDIISGMVEAPPGVPVTPAEFPDWPDEQQLARRLWQLRRPYRVEYSLDDERYRLTVPAGYTYDGASVPRLAWSFIAADKLHKGACVHDFTYEVGGAMPLGSWQVKDERGVWRRVSRTMSRKESDRIFLQLVREDPEGPRTTVGERAAYRAVRMFGRGSFGPKPPRRVP